MKFAIFDGVHFLKLRTLREPEGVWADNPLAARVFHDRGEAERALKRLKAAIVGNALYREVDRVGPEVEGLEDKVFEAIGSARDRCKQLCILPHPIQQKVEA